MGFGLNSGAHSLGCDGALLGFNVVLLSSLKTEFLLGKALFVRLLMNCFSLLALSLLGYSLLCLD